MKRERRCCAAAYFAGRVSARFFLGSGGAPGRFKISRITHEDGIVRNKEPRLRAGCIFRPHANKPPGHLPEIQLRGNRARIHADAQSGNIDAFADHVDGNEPMVARPGELKNSAACVRFFRDGNLRRLSGEISQLPGDQSGVLLGLCDDQSAGRWVGAATGNKLLMRRSKHRCEPLR